MKWYGSPNSQLVVFTVTTDVLATEAGVGGKQAYAEVYSCSRGSGKESLTKFLSNCFCFPDETISKPIISERKGWLLEVKEKRTETLQQIRTVLPTEELNFFFFITVGFFSFPILLFLVTPEQLLP